MQNGGIYFISLRTLYAKYNQYGFCILYVILIINALKCCLLKMINFIDYIVVMSLCVCVFFYLAFRSYRYKCINLTAHFSQNILFWIFFCIYLLLIEKNLF